MEGMAMEMQDGVQKGATGTGRWMGAAGVAALLASACCLGPIVLAALGLSVAGFSAAFEPLRPVFLVLTVGLLGVAFYFSYFRRPACAPGAACAVDAPRVRRTRTLLWLATVGVLLVALFPVYGGTLLRVGRRSAFSSAAPVGRVIRLDIAGMTCGACAASIEKSLQGVPGVRSASVSYSDGKAVVEAAPYGAPTEEALLGAVKLAGYQARIVGEAE